MHLRSIKLRGFKSFPDPVEVKLEPGVAVVVGPNGSGKSNVSDAIVWASGSLTPSELRAEKPDDVLFGGAAGRAPADHCEVELVFDNEDGGFGPELDYSEISITRRLVRGGEGQYLVNRTPVRRTDLVELLADVGLGGSMHSIVSQGKVDAVLASSPEHRRELIEEAAGLGKFKRRKHRAELKLARVAIQVERARDVEEEVRKRLRPLALQATAAERAEKLRSELAGLRGQLARLDLAGIAERRSAADERKAAAQIARRSAQESLTNVLAEREQAESELSDAAGSREQALGALYRVQGAGERLALRREAVTDLAARLDDDLREAERAVAARSDGAVLALEAAAAEAQAAARETATRSGQAAERARQAHARVAVRERAVAAGAEARLADVRAQRQRIEAELAEVSGGQATANRTLMALGSARERLRARHENAAALAERLATDHAEAKRLAARGGPTPAELERAANDAKTDARAAATERDDIAERARAASDRLAALERSLAEREGVAPAARALAAEGQRLALASLQPEPGSEHVIAAALAWRASALLAADTTQGLALVERARIEGLGSLAVVIAGESRPASLSSPPVPGARPLRELAEGSPDALRLLDGIWLVSSDQLLEARAGIVITRAGQGFDADRGELWFAGETPEGVLLEMDARRRALVGEVEELTARARAAVTAAGEAATRAAAAEEAYAAVAHLRERVLDAELLARLHGCADGLVASCARAIAAVTRIEAPVTARVNAGAERATEQTTELRRLAELESTAAHEAASAVRSAQAAEVVVARLGGTVSGLVDAGEAVVADLVEEARAALELADDAARVARSAADRAQAAEAALIARAPRRSGLDVDLVSRLATIVTQVGATLDRASVSAAALEAPVRARADAGAARSAQLGSRLRELGAQEVEFRRRSDETAERSTAIEVELARLDAEREEAERRLEEATVELAALQPDLAPGDVAEDAGAADAEGSQGEAQVESISRTELAAKIERLDARREALGKVNPLAKEEYASEKERLDDLATQRQDLEDSLRELEKLRDELAATVAQRFDDTFARVAANFEEVASTLFPGGEGRLRLVESEDEDGEPGVEVELRPAGKKITRLTLLSGGEKALGAISFLFSLFLAKPCPFYLLDEVEAALDDANITLFVELLRRYADRAQFVVITHQKRTMEAADVLYGVTMGGDGVSQIVSRRLPRETAATLSATA